MPVLGRLSFRRFLLITIIVALYLRATLILYFDASISEDEDDEDAFARLKLHPFAKKLEELSIENEQPFLRLERNILENIDGDQKQNGQDDVKRDVLLHKTYNIKAEEDIKNGMRSVLTKVLQNDGYEFAKGNSRHKNGVEKNADNSFYGNEYKKAADRRKEANTKATLAKIQAAATTTRRKTAKKAVPTTTTLTTTEQGEIVTTTALLATKNTIKKAAKGEKQEKTSETGVATAKEKLTLSLTTEIINELKETAAKKNVFQNQNREQEMYKNSQVNKSKTIAVIGTEYRNTTTKESNGIIRKKDKGNRSNAKMPVAKGKINVYTYLDIFPDHDNLNVYWNPLFPQFPHRSFFAKKLEDDFWLNGTMTRRFLGYLNVPKTGYYTFRVSTRQGLDMLLFQNKFSNKSVILRFGLSINEILRQKATELYKGVSEQVWLEIGKQYPIDIIHAFTTRGRFTLEFKRREDSSFAVIGSSHLSPLHDYASVNVSIPDCYWYTGGVPPLRQKFNHDKRLHFWSKKQISSSTCNTGLETCTYKPTYLYKQDKIELYYGQMFVQKNLIYPFDNTNYFPNDHKENKFLDENVAKAVANDVFTAINAANKGIYELLEVVHVEENHDKNRYFVELDLKRKEDGKIYRFSDYFARQSSNKKLCLPEGYSSKWSHQTPFYLVCVVKNQRRWIQYLIKSLEDLIKRTNERNIHLVMVDFNSTDTDVHKLLEISKLSFTFLSLNGKFSKVRGLNEGVKSIPYNESIVFVMDLQLQIPDHLFDQARKHTIQGRMTYCPILIRLWKNQNPEYTELTKHSIWMSFGYGMMSIYKSDWDRIGGMNEKLFKHKWGGEDWEFVDRVMLAKLELIHPRLPGFYHIYHSTLGTWDGTKMF